MKPEARIQSVIDLLEQTYRDVASTPADIILNNYVRQRRYIGSTDRREISNLFYDVLRSYWILQGYLCAAGYGISMKDVPSLARLHGAIYLLKIQHKSLKDLQRIFNGEEFCPSPLKMADLMILEKIAAVDLSQLTEAAQLGVSQLSLDRLKQQFPESYRQEIIAQQNTASLDLRVNTLKTTREAVMKQLKKEKIDYALTSYSPWGVRLSQRIPLASHRLLKEGWVEVQDEGSQLIALAVGAKPGMHVWDYCAGAGGKTLAIAAMMENKGRILATDALEWRLKKSHQRFRRAGVHNVECRVLDESQTKWIKRQHQKFDRVLVDAPCSGSGTWRRNPELKWRLTETDLNEISQKQRDILSKAALLVKPGGYLIYATCSLYPQENQEQIAWFLEQNPGFSLHPITLPFLTSPVDYLQLSPGTHGTDGFFACVMVSAAKTDEK